MPHTDNMPTAARAMAALMMAVLGWFASEMIRPLMPEATNFGVFNYVNVALGLIVGWRITGKNLGRGWSNGISAGLTGVACLVVLGLFVQSLNKMLGLALDGRFGGLMEGINGMFLVATEYGSVLLDGPLIGFLVAGGLVIGVIGEWVSHRWS